jgi:hypothetical protein
VPALGKFTRTTARLSRRGAAWLLAVFFSLCAPDSGRAVDSRAAAAKATAIATNLSVPEPQPYIRLAHPDSNTIQLQIAARRFVPAAGTGPTVWLAGASHIGDPAYYRALQKHLDAQTIVLYEGVNSDTHPRHVPKPGAPADKPLPPPASAPASTPPAAGSETNAGYSMQSALATSLGLVFQLDAIDYDRTNFLNSDLSVLQIQRLLLNDPGAPAAAPGEKGRSSPTFDALLQIMDGSSFIGSIAKWAVQSIGADPKMQATTKFMLIEALGGMKGDFSQLRGLPPDVQNLLKILVQARNQNVLDDLKAESAAIPRSGSIAIFYGTGHMPDLEKRLTGEFHYRPDGDLWFTAFSVDLRQTGLSLVEIEWTRALIKSQLDQLQP